jgi:hypothetical protein
MAAPKYLIDLAERNTRLLERLAELELKATNRPALRSRERRIIGAIGKQSLIAKQIAKLIGVELTKGLQAVLADMVRWGILIHDGDGYAVATEWQGAAEVEDDDDENP